MTQAPSTDLHDDGPPPAQSPEVEVGEAELAEVPDSGATAPAGQIEILLDTTVEVTAVLGTVRLAVRDLLQRGPGAVIQLQREAGEPVDLLLNGIRFATGHLVVVGDRLGVRIKEILKPEVSADLL
jgi:flagellar motor switch protein FliN/FliY